MAKVNKKNKKKEEIKMDNVQKTQSVIRGRVTSAKKPQTVTVLVESVKKHPLYGKTYKRSKKYLVHDLLGVSEGDIVEILQVRPISKNKHLQVLRVVGKDIEAIVSEQLKEDAKEAIAEVMPEEEKVSQGEEVSQVPQGEEKEVEKKTRGTRGTRRTSDTSKEAK